MLTDFSNEPLLDFSNDTSRRLMAEAVEAVQSRLGAHYPLVLGGERVDTRDRIRSVNPAQPDETVGTVAKADAALADRAIAEAEKAFVTWRRWDPAARARILWRAAAALRRRKFEFSAWLVFEAGKSWAEADADTAEAIDFLEFYGREGVRWSREQPATRLPGEENHVFYIPLGVGVVIPPWNFPLAIMAGMTTAAAVAGNTVVLKPASVTPVVAAKFVELLEEAGIPPGVVNFCPGSGGAIGDRLVQHPRTRFISFTGSRDVGLRIWELAAKRSPGQIWLKRVIAEMGGKDAILVDETADLDAAADGIVASAFGYQGQKCSACSRAIVVKSVYRDVVERVVARAKTITVGPPRDPRNAMGPVIDQAAFDKIREYIAVGRGEGNLVLGAKPAEGPGYFIPPTIVEGVAPAARIACEEIFGPVLAMIPATDFGQGLEIANATEYGLTGAVFSRDRARLERAREEFHCGNLYFNRKCTGALVDVHPFGGFNMSGTDSKAGGRDYLGLFLQMKSVCERL
ncbi:MAG: L-glutamate gamma-semialdehyde dehydrogenase [Candidatus Brocadiae bacterium]|nr:L-glutamate gamma-semialdehyde dehydrogenase [Candidatus Brocadiia bacterium]